MWEECCRPRFRPTTRLREVYSTAITLNKGIIVNAFRPAPRKIYLVAQCLPTPTSQNCDVAGEGLGT